MLPEQGATSCPAKPRFRPGDDRTSSKPWCSCDCFSKLLLRFCVVQNKPHGYRSRKSIAETNSHPNPTRFTTNAFVVSYQEAGAQRLDRLLLLRRVGHVLQFHPRRQGLQAGERCDRSLYPHAGVGSSCSAPPRLMRFPARTRSLDKARFRSPPAGSFQEGAAVSSWAPFRFVSVAFWSHCMLAAFGAHL